jgi:hypothetical protein
VTDALVALPEAVLTDVARGLTPAQVARLDEALRVPLHVE